MKLHKILLLTTCSITYPAVTKGAKGRIIFFFLNKYTIKQNTIPVAHAHIKTTEVSKYPIQYPITAASLMSPIPRPLENKAIMKNKTKKKRPQRVFPGIEEGDERISLKRRIKKNIAVRMSGILFVRISQIEMITRYKRQSASKITYKQCSFISVKYRKKNVLSSTF